MVGEGKHIQDKQKGKEVTSIQLGPEVEEVRITVIREKDDLGEWRKAFTKARDGIEEAKAKLWDALRLNNLNKAVKAHADLIFVVSNMDRHLEKVKKAKMGNADY